MIKIKFLKKLEEAMKVENMGLPQIIITLIKEDLDRREDQVFLAQFIKSEKLKPDVAEALVNVLSPKVRGKSTSFIDPRIREPQFSTSAWPVGPK